MSALVRFVVIVTVVAVLSSGVSADGRLALSGYGAAGNVSFETTDAVYVRELGETVAPSGSWLVVLRFRIGGPLAFVPREQIELTLESISPEPRSWDIDWDLTFAAEQREGLDFWRCETGGQVGEGVAVFVIPDAEKALWCRLDSRVGASPEKVYSGGLRHRLGDLPGEERIFNPRPGYRVIIGSFWVRENAQRWAETARKRGLTAWIEPAIRPEGMYVVVSRQADTFDEMPFFAGVARDHGYHDAFVSRVRGL